MGTSFEEQWEVERTVRFIVDGGHRRVALQFPDELLGASTRVAAALAARCPSSTQVAVLADTAFNPEAVDEVAAQHMDATCIVHYGRASLAAPPSLPVLYVFPRAPLDAPACARAVATAARAQPLPAEAAPQAARHVVLFLDQALVHAGAELRAEVQAALSASSSSSPGAPQEWWQVTLARPALASHSGASPGVAAQQGQAHGQHELPKQQQPHEAASHQQQPPQGWLEVAGYTWPSPLHPPEALQPQEPAAGAPAHGQQQQQQQQEQGGMDPRPPPPIAQLLHVWVGPSSGSEQALQALQLGCPASIHLGAAPGGGGGGGGEVPLTWVHVHVDAERGVPEGQPQVGLSPRTLALIKRRAFLVEKARASAILGVLVGTLASAGLQAALAHLRRLVGAAGKRSYTVLVGKPNPAKLANFPEVEVWVQLSDPLGAILDSRDFLSPLITPHEAVLALTGGMMTPGTAMHLGLAPLMGSEQQRQAQLAAAARAFAGDEDGDEEEGEQGGDGALQVRFGGLGLGLSQAAAGGSGGSKALQARHGAEFLQMRTWQGVDAPVAGAEHKAPQAAVEGLSGRAAQYEQEPARGTA